MHHKATLISLVLILAFGVSCAPKKQPTDATAEKSTAAPTRTLTVLAAASLAESFTELGNLFEAENTGVTISFNFAGSQVLAEQLAQGADADVFASASKKYMTAVIDAKRVRAGAPKEFANNRLVVIFPIENPGEIAELKDLAKPGLKLVLADASVPVGQYSIDFLDKASADAAFGADYKDKVLANAVSNEDNVKAVVTKVTLGEADAGIVYVTDIKKDAANKIGRLDIPDALNTIATYPIAPIADSKSPDLAAKFVELVISEKGQSVLAGYGFIVEIK